MKKRNLTALISVCAAIAVFAGCGNNAASTTTAAATTTTAATTTAETTTTAAETTTTTTTEAETEPEEEDENPFGDDFKVFNTGVWSAANENGETEAYFVFYDTENGTMLHADTMSGVPFTVEQQGTEAMFHFGSAEDETPATISLGDAYAVFEFDEGEKTFYFKALDGVDVEAFLADPGQFLDMANGAGETEPYVFNTGMYAVTYGGQLAGYYAFSSASEGVYSAADGTVVVPFTCVQAPESVTLTKLTTGEEETLSISYTDEGAIIASDGEAEVTISRVCGIAETPQIIDDDSIVIEAPIFTTGVYLAATNNLPYGYFVFTDEENGSFLNYDGKSGVPFVCEQDTNFVLFHMGSADDNSQMVIKVDAEGHFVGKDPDSDSYVIFSKVYGADAETFEVPVVDEEAAIANFAELIGNAIENIDFSQLGESLEGLEGLEGVDLSALGESLEGVDLSALGEGLEGVDLSALGESLEGVDLSALTNAASAQ
ncbi:MAG: hypothetical protein IK093_11925 [Ruminiclostridium sp.]|nr:hypothetical protein [Ruminiclostridium sp.]